MINIPNYRGAREALIIKVLEGDGKKYPFTETEYVIEKNGKPIGTVINYHNEVSDTSN